MSRQSYMSGQLVFVKLAASMEYEVPWRPTEPPPASSVDTLKGGVQAVGDGFGSFFNAKANPTYARHAPYAAATQNQGAVTSLINRGVRTASNYRRNLGVTTALDKIKDTYNRANAQVVNSQPDILPIYGKSPFVKDLMQTVLGPVDSAAKFIENNPTVRSSRRAMTNAANAASAFRDTMSGYTNRGIDSASAAATNALQRANHYFSRPVVGGQPNQAKIDLKHRSR